MGAVAVGPWDIPPELAQLASGRNPAERPVDRDWPVEARSGRPGRKPKPRAEIADKMLADLTSGQRTAEELEGNTLDALKTEYGGSRNTADVARKHALARFSEIQKTQF
jgi:hypothetical protein